MTFEVYAVYVVPLTQRLALAVVAAAFALFAALVALVAALVALLKASTALLYTFVASAENSAIEFEIQVTNASTRVENVVRSFRCGVCAGAGVMLGGVVCAMIKLAHSL